MTEDPSGGAQQDAPLGELPETPSIDDALRAEADTAVRRSERVATDDSHRPFALDNSEANRLAARRRPTVLVLAGQPSSGKTSVFAAIYERLSRGPLAGRLFAGSKTIPGFEARCHHWRVSSGFQVPQMEHTRAEDLPWLHLQLRDQARERPREDLLLGDFDGEYFRQLTRNEIQPSNLPFLHRADLIGIVVDGARLADLAEQEAELANLEYLTDALTKDSASISPEALVLVITKLDMIESMTTDRSAINEILDRARATVEQHVEREVAEVRLAVRSLSDRFPLGHGLESLLELVDTRPALQYPDEPPPVPRSSPQTRFVG